jgi:hypothetical protein
MDRNHLRPLVGVSLALAMWAVNSLQPIAAPGEVVLERFVARAANVDDASAATSPVEIMIERWSTDKEVAALGSTLSKGGPATLLPALQQTWQRAGVVLTPGIIGAGSRARTRRARNLMFAHSINTAAGRQIVVAAYEHLALGELPVDPRHLKPEFMLLDIRFGADGKGIGKVGLATSVAVNERTKLIEVHDFAGQPVRLSAVRSEKP